MSVKGNRREPFSSPLSAKEELVVAVIALVALVVVIAVFDWIATTYSWRPLDW